MNINSITASFANLMSKNNTITSSTDLSANLNTRVQSVIAGVDGNHNNIAVPLTSYPIIFVQANNSQRNIRELGNSSRRDIDITLNIIGVTHYGMSTADERSGRENADREALELANNIEQIIDADITASSTVQWIYVSNSDYSANITDKAYNSIVNIELKGMVRQ